MKLRTAFFLSLLAVLLVMAAPALFGIGHIREVRSLTLDLRERAAEAAFVVGRTQAELERLDRYQRSHVVTGDPELAERTRAAVDSLEAHLDKLHDAGYAPAVAAARPAITSLGAVSNLTILLMEAGHREAATALLRHEVAPRMEDAATAASALAGAVDDLTTAHVARVERITRRAEATTIMALGVALLVALGLALLAVRFLSRPLNQLSTSMARVADGSFGAPHDLPYDRRDEIGDLLRAFRSMALQLADLDRMKAEFVSIASHDMKTPVNVISGYAELMNEELAPTLEERHRKVLDSLWRQSRTLSARVNQLLEVSRIQASGLRLGLEEVNLRHFVAELSRSHHSAAVGNGVKLETAIDDSAPTFLIADPDCLRNEVFANLLENSFRFTPRGGRARLSVSGYGGMVIFELHDDGPAIPVEGLERAFDRYYRGGRVSGRIGAGLGLPIARAGAEAHGGTVEAEAPSDGGCTFRVTLPIHPTLPIEPDPTSRAAEVELA